MLVETNDNRKPEFDVSLPSPDLPLAELSGEDVNSVLSLDAAVSSIIPPTDIDDVLGLPGLVTDSIYSFLVTNEVRHLGAVGFPIFSGYYISLSVV